MKSSFKIQDIELTLRDPELVIDEKLSTAEIERLANYFNTYSHEERMAENFPDEIWEDWTALEDKVGADVYIDEETDIEYIVELDYPMELAKEINESIDFRRDYDDKDGVNAVGDGDVNEQWMRIRDRQTAEELFNEIKGKLRKLIDG